LPANAACQSPHMLTEPPLSQASQLPHLDLCQAENLSSPPIPCGSGLARECGVSVTTHADRTTAFAGKPAPTLGPAPDPKFKPTPDPLWERACSRRRRVSHHKCCPNHRFRRQVAPTFGPVPGREFELTPNPLWERACSRRRRVSHHKCWPNHRFRRQASLCLQGLLNSEG
jgi:hypothetical protein